jgi:large subunit ribosomal protein L25
MTESFFGTVAKNEFIKAFKEVGTSTVVDLTGDSKELVLIHSYQLNPVKGELIHVDFLAVNADEKVTAEVRIIVE